VQRRTRLVPMPARGTGQVSAGVSGEPTGANCGRSEVLRGYEDGGRAKASGEVNKATDKYGGACQTSVMEGETDSSQRIAENLAPLQRIQISVDGITRDLMALHDSGSQINLIRRSLLPDDKLKSVGRVCNRGAFGAPIQTEVVMLAIKPTVVEHYEVNIAPAQDALFAVCEDLVQQVILTADTVRHLNSLKQYDVIHVPEPLMVKSLVSTVPGEGIYTTMR
jgi:hypothetical protein